MNGPYIGSLFIHLPFYMRNGESGIPQKWHLEVGKI